MSDLFFERALLSVGWAEKVAIRVENGRIVSVDVGSDRSSGAESHGIGIPGLPNLHSHAFQRGMAGLTEIRGPASDSFWTWRDLMYRFVALMSPDDVEAIACQAYVEMLQAGFTRVGEFHYLHHDRDGSPYANIAELGERIVAAASATGIGLTLLPVFYAHAGFGEVAPAEGQRRFINDPDRYAALIDASRKALVHHDGSVLGIAPHSLRAATENEIKAILPLAGEGPIHLHIAEQMKEVEDCIAWSGERPVEWLTGRFAVDGRWCLIHATHLTAGETARIASSGAVAGLCPITEANLGDGVFDAPLFMAGGGATGVGTDSNVSIDAAGELRQLEYSQRLHLRGRNILAAGEGLSTGRTLFDAALAGGSKALGVSASGLSVGAPADIVSLDADSIALIGRSKDALLDAWIFASPAPIVDCVWVAGRKCVEGGRHPAADAIGRRFRATMSRVLGA